MLGSKLSLFLYHFLTRLSVQTGIFFFFSFLFFFPVPKVLFSFQFPSPLTSFLSSLPFPSVRCRLMRSFLQNILVPTPHHSSDSRAAQHFRVLCITLTHEPRRCFRSHWPKLELIVMVLWPPSAPQPKKIRVWLRAWCQLREEGNFLIC